MCGLNETKDGASVTKTILMLTFLLTLISCQDLQQNSSSSRSSSQISIGLPQEEDSPTDSTSTNDLPSEAFLFDASIQFTNFKPHEEEKVLKAIEIIKAVISSQEFKQRVLNFEFSGKKQFVDNQGLSNEEIYFKLLQGSESLTPETDHEMDLELELYFSHRNTVGYTYPEELKIWMNKKFFNFYTPAEVAANLFHEWTHKLGFTHSFRYNKARDFSVPYGLGYLILELGRKYE
jgi:hypothetical protein